MDHTIERPREAANAMEADRDLPSFSELDLSPQVMEAVAELGYEHPSPVQARAIPEVLAGRDVLAAAQTGTGKTAAFLLPILSTLGHHQRHQGPQVLIVTPTRELAQQIEDACRTICAHTHHRSVTVVGGVSYNPQRSALQRGCDVLVATPGRLIDLMGTGDVTLNRVSCLVLDEADRMLDMGFLPMVRRIVAACPADRQTLLFSATLDEGRIGAVTGLVHDPATIEIAHRGTAAETIDQYLLPVSPEVKNGLLPRVLETFGHDRVIVFCRTKHRADAVCRRLRKAGISCAPIHGNRSQNQRERALRAFRDGDVDVLVATDVLSRGIDVRDVDYVVNFDFPGDPEDYVHRIGRTGRAGETGWALTFVTPDEVGDLLACEALMADTVPCHPRAQELDLGAEPPILDEDRVPAKVKAVPTSGKHRRSRTKAAAARAVSRAEAAKGAPRRSKGAGSGAKAGGSAGGEGRGSGPKAKAPKAGGSTKAAGTKGENGSKTSGAKGSKGSANPKAQAKTRRPRGSHRSGAGPRDGQRPQGSPKTQEKRPRSSRAQRSPHPTGGDGWQSYQGPRKGRSTGGRRPGDRGGKAR